MLTIIQQRLTKSLYYGISQDSLCNLIREFNVAKMYLMFSNTNLLFNLTDYKEKKLHKLFRSIGYKLKVNLNTSHNIIIERCNGIRCIIGLYLMYYSKEFMNKALYQTLFHLYGFLAKVEDCINENKTEWINENNEFTKLATELGFTDISDSFMANNDGELIISNVINKGEFYPKLFSNVAEKISKSGIKPVRIKFELGYLNNNDRNLYSIILRPLI